MRIKEIKDMSIVGYSDVLTKEMLPTNVPPIFFDGKDGVYVPPYLLRGGYIIGPAQISKSEIRHFSEKNSVTLFSPDQKIEAKPDHLLWVDEKFTAHYGSRLEVEAIFKAIFEQTLVKALDFLRSGSFSEVERECNKMISVDCNRTEPFAIEAAVYSYSQRKDMLSVVYKMAETRVGRGLFEIMVSHYERMIP